MFNTYLSLDDIGGGEGAEIPGNGGGGMVVGGGGRGGPLYLTLHCHHSNDSGIKIGSD